MPKRRRRAPYPETGKIEFERSPHDDFMFPHWYITLEYVVWPGEEESEDDPGSGAEVDFGDLPDGLELTHHEVDLLVEEVTKRHGM